MSEDAMCFVCPRCGQVLQDVFWDGEQWLWSTEDDMVPCFLDSEANLWAISLAEQPYIPSEIIKVHSHGYSIVLSKFSFFKWCVIIAAAVVVLLGVGLPKDIAWKLQ